MLGLQDRNRLPLVPEDLDEDMDERVDLTQRKRSAGTSDATRRDVSFQLPSDKRHKDIIDEDDGNEMLRPLSSDAGSVFQFGAPPKRNISFGRGGSRANYAQRSQSPPQRK